MPVCNIIDKRNNKYKIECDVAVEDSYNNNNIEGSTQFPMLQIVGYAEIGQCIISDAIMYLNNVYPNCPLTLYIYDLNTLTDVRYTLYRKNGNIGLKLAVTSDWSDSE